MPPILKQKALVVPLIGLFIAAYFHWRGRHLTTDDKSHIDQGVGLLFDLVSSNFAWLYVKHNQNKQAIQQNQKTLEVHGDALATVANRVAAETANTNGGIPNANG